MYFLILPIMYVSVTTGLNEPLTLVRSIFLISWVLVFFIIHPQNFRVKNPWQWSLLAIPGFYILSAIFNKQNPTLALLGNYNRNFGLLTLFAIGFMVIYISNSNLTVRHFLNWGLWPVTLVTLIYGFVQVVGKDPILWAEPDRTTLTLGNSDYAAALLAILILLPIYKFFQTKNYVFRLFTFAVVLAEIKLGLFSQAYQFRVLAAFSIAGFLVINFWQRIKQLRKITTIPIFVFSGILLVRYLTDPATELLQRINFTDRISQQQMGLRMFLDHPILGVGIDQFWRFVPLYLRPRDIQINGSLVVPDKTHNLIIDHLAMGGILVGLTFLIFLIYSLVTVYKFNRSHTKTEKSPEFVFLSVVWVTYVIHLFISTDNVFMMTLGYATFGLILRCHFEAKVKDAGGKNSVTQLKVVSPNVLRITTTFLLIAVSVVNIRAVIADVKVKNVLSNQVKSGDEIIQTLRYFPNPKTAEEVIVYLLQNLQNCPVAIVASDDLLKIDNRSAQAWYFKTLCSDASNDQKTALSYINKSIEFQPVNLIYWDAKVRLEVRLKEFDAAKKSIEQIRLINPSYASINDLESLVADSVTN